MLMTTNLPSGYHRDYQLTKGPLFSALDELGRMLDIAARLPHSLRVVEDRCAAAVTEDLLATHEAIALVKNGVPFRLAYRQVAESARSAGVPRPVVEVELPYHLGAPGRPDWKFLAADNVRASRWAKSTRARLRKAWGALLA